MTERKFRLIRGGNGDIPPAPPPSPEVMKAGVHPTLDFDTNRTLIPFLSLDISPESHAVIQALPPDNPLCIHFIPETKEGLWLSKPRSDSEPWYWREDYKPLLTVSKNVGEEWVSLALTDIPALETGLSDHGIRVPEGFQKKLSLAMRKSLLSDSPSLTDFTRPEKSL